MFRKILVPVDFTDKNEPALDAALGFARSAGGGSPEGPLPEILMVHVIETIDHLGFEEMQDFYRGLETRAAAKLFALEKRFQDAGVPVHHEILYGRRAETILRLSEEAGVDLIVLSSHKVDREHPALGLGTISYRIAIVARCPVLLVK
jgi:nucleotide-binding universal stress UspA family protein